MPIEHTSTPFGQVKTMFNTAIPERGANLTSPVSGAIVRWRIQGAKGGPFYLRVLHPNGAGAYSSAGTSGGVTPSGTGVEVFSANIPIKAGDQIGIDPTNPTDEIGIAPVANASFGFIFPPPPDGATVAPNGTGSGEIELSAEVQPTPAVTGLSTNLGPIGGGTEVTITGTDLNGTSAVKFGELPAASYSVKSDTQIVAVAPPSTEPGQIDVTVTTVAGTSAANLRSDGFTYQACVVPNLKRNKLGTAKTRLRNAGCKPGTVRKLGEATAKDGLVVIQSPRPGTILPPGAKVNVKLGLPLKEKQQAK
ncbi:MAG TPA: IPT/TIG domain-containing protein [Solirubrobacterales bacterium]|nr:IPT/TIG domain-containing protein [Solirubrobacterales bacterium]